MRFYMNIIIPSAKLVPEELQNLGKLPAVIYPVNQRIVFDYLWEQYSGSNFTVVCYENNGKVHRRLSKYSGIRFIDLDELGDLGYSVCKGISDLGGEGIINFADTIVEDDILSRSADSFFYAEDEFSSKWTFFEEHEGIISSIIDKKNLIEQRGCGKLFVGVFKFSHLEYLYECLVKALNVNSQSMNSFYYALIMYSEKYPITPIKAANWLDIGHADKYYNSQLEVKARTFNHIGIDKNRGILTKTSDNIDKFLGEIKWYLKLPTDVEYVRPRIFAYSLDYTSPYVSMEYYAYHTVHELFLYSDLNKKQWSDIFTRILFVCNDLKRYTLEDKSVHEALEDMYLVKTIHRFNQMRENGSFSSFFSNSITVNDKKYISLDSIITILKDIVPVFLYDVKSFNIIHGDLCFANIMVDNNFSFIKLIDPRGKFGKFDIYGDQRYELAKLFHSIDGKYDFIIKNMFEVFYDIDKCIIKYNIIDRTRDYNLFQVFITVFKEAIGDDIKKIELIEALLFLSMIPLHNESSEHQMVMLGTGLDILNRVIDITEKNRRL